jgi:hypothetical protein
VIVMSETDSQAETAIAALQTALNERGAPRGYPPLPVDGILGPLTRQALQDLGHALGIEPEVLAAEQLAPEVAQLFTEPKQRSTQQVEAAVERAGALAARPIELDGVKLAWGLVKPLVRARKAGWSGALQRVVRGVDVLGSLFEGEEAWWHRVLEVSDEGELLSILNSMGYACELVAHSSGLVGASGLRFLQEPGPVQPGIAGTTADAAAQADPTQAQEPPAETAAADIAVASPATTGVEARATTAVEAPAPTATEPPAEPPTITGPDVSAEQGEVDWNQVAAGGHRFAFIKASSGVDRLDPRFVSNWNAAGTAGIRRAVYHVAELAPATDPGDQAVNLIAAIRAVGSWEAADLPPSVDVDQLAEAVGGEQTADWVRDFSAVFERITHSLPAIRMTAESFERAFGSDASAIDSPIWVSGGGGSGAPGLVRFEPLPGPQQCPGITRSCQLSRFDGSQEQFDQLRAITTSTK